MSKAFKRIIIKLSGEGLAGETNDHFHEPTINRIAKEVAEVIANGTEVGIVVGGGNFWRGRDAKPEMDKVKAHQIGMLGTIMNGLYLSEAFRLAGIPAVVMTPFDVNGFTQKFSMEDARKYMAQKTAVIFAGGTGHPFFSTDSIVALRACELSADAVLYAKSIDCVYTADPKKDASARRYKTVPYETVVQNRLDVADITALSLTMQHDIPSVVFALNKPNAIVIASKGGGLCQMSNLLFWVFLHSPMTIVERHTHDIKDFPTARDGEPEGVDATVSEGWRDLKVKNDTDKTFQIGIVFDAENIYAALF